MLHQERACAADSAITEERSSVELLIGVEAIAGIADAWLDLESAANYPAFFQSHAWCMHVAGVRAAASPGTYVPVVAVGRAAGRIAAIWPLSLQKSIGLWSLRSLDEPFGQFSGVLARDQRAATQLAVGTIEAVRSRKLAHTARFERIVVGDWLHAALVLAGAAAVATTGAPYIQLARFASIDSLRSSRNKKSMKNLRNATNRLARDQTLEAMTVRSGAHLNALVDATLELRKIWLLQKGVMSPAFRTDGHREILIGGAAERIGFELRRDNKPIALQWGFVHRNRYYAYMSAMDMTQEDLSPGRVHLGYVIAAAKAEGFEGAELLTPASDYKLMWTDDVHALTDMTLSLGPLGWLKGALWDAGLRPAIKAIYYALPARLRRAAQVPHG